MYIKIIYCKNTIQLKALCNSTHCIIMLPHCFKITKTRKEIKSIIKIVDVERQSYIMQVKMQVICFMVFRFNNGGGAKVNPRNIKTLCSKGNAMPAFTTGCI